MARSKKKNPLQRFEDRSVTADAIVAHRRRVTKSDLRSKLRELGAYTDDPDDPAVAVAEVAVQDAVIEVAEHEARRDLGPLGALLATVPKTQLVIAIGFTTLIVVYKLGEIVGRPRGPQIEVRKLTFPLTD